MSPLDRRKFLRGALGVAAATVAGCADSEPETLAPNEVSPTAPTPSIRAAPEPGTSNASSPTPSPTPDEVASSPTPPRLTQLEVICREGWDADPSGRLDPHTVRQLTVHHTAVRLDDNRQAPARLRQHQDYHQSLGWPDIAYHLGVDRHGHVYELRRPDVRGDTATEYDPAGHFLVVALGHYDQQSPTAAQVEGIARAFAWGAITFDVGGSTLTGHREHASTTCPGDRLQSLLPSIRERVAALVAAGVERRDICGAEAVVRVAAISAGTDAPLEV